MANKIRVPDPEGAMHIFNENGELVRIKYPSGQVNRYKNGELVRIKCPNGTVRHYENGEFVRAEWLSEEVWYFNNGEYPDGSDEK